jgi:hypothetical protein
VEPDEFSTQASDKTGIPQFALKKDSSKTRPVIPQNMAFSKPAHKAQNSGYINRKIYGWD